MVIAETIRTSHKLMVNITVDEVRRLLITKSIEHSNNIDFTDLDISELNFIGLNIVSVNFSNIRCIKTKFIKIYLPKSDFQGKI
jgi:hypothetical protein